MQQNSHQQPLKPLGIADFRYRLLQEVEAARQLGWVGFPVVNQVVLMENRRLHFRFAGRACLSRDRQKRGVDLRFLSCRFFCLLDLLFLLAELLSEGGKKGMIWIRPFVVGDAG